MMHEEAPWTPERITALRARYKLSQTAFAKMVGTSLRWQTVSEWERGAHRPSPIYSLMLTRLETRIDRIYTDAGGDEEKLAELLHKRMGIVQKKKGGRPRGPKKKDGIS